MLDPWVGGRRVVGDLFLGRGGHTEGGLRTESSVKLNDELELF